MCSLSVIVTDVKDMRFSLLGKGEDWFRWEKIIYKKEPYTPSVHDSLNQYNIQTNYFTKPILASSSQMALP